MITVNSTGITTQISLIDKMTAPLQNITKAVNNVVSGFNVASNSIENGMNPSTINRTSSAFANMSSDVDSVTFASSDLSRSISQIPEVVNSLKYSFMGFDENIKNGFDTGPIDSFAYALDELGIQAKEVSNLEPIPPTPNGNFNTSISTSNSLLGNLWKKISTVALAWVSFEGAKKVISISDDLTQTVARIDMINDGMQTTTELQEMIFQSAERSRGAYNSTADAVAKISQNAGDIFKSNSETIQFTENLNKLFTVAGSSVMEMESATLQLTQALGSGVLRGEELNAVFEAAPNIIQTIADYMGVPIGQIRTMASEGEISAEIVKNAMLGATSEINEQFDNMPLTFAQIWQSFKNNALMAFTPVFTKISEIANSTGFNQFVDSAINGMYNVSAVVCNAFDVISALAVFVYDNWASISPAIMGVVTALGIFKGYVIANNTVEAISKGLKIASMAASYAKAAATGSEASATAIATATQYGFNTALLACPLTWMIIGIIAVIAVIYGVIAIINKWCGTTISATGVIMGVIFTAGAFIGNCLIAVLDIGLIVVNCLQNAFCGFGNFFANFLDNPVSSVINLVADMCDSMLSMLNNLAKGFDALFGSDLSGAVSGFRNTVRGFADNLIKKYASDEAYQEVFTKNDITAESLLGFDRFDYGNAYDSGYAFGEGLGGFSDMFSGDFGMDDYAPTDSNIPSYDEMSPYSGDSGTLNDISANTGSMADSMDLSNEDLSYLREMAERENINKFTTANVTVGLGGITNNVAKDVDLDGMVDYLVRNVKDNLEVVANGNYT